MTKKQLITLVIVAGIGSLSYMGWTFYRMNHEYSKIRQVRISNQNPPPHQPAQPSFDWKTVTQFSVEKVGQWKVDFKKSDDRFTVKHYPQKAWSYHLSQPREIVEKLGDRLAQGARINRILESLGSVKLDFSEKQLFTPGEGDLILRWSIPPKSPSQPEGYYTFETRWSLEPLAVLVGKKTAHPKGLIVNLIKEITQPESLRQTRLVSVNPSDVRIIQALQGSKVVFKARRLGGRWESGQSPSRQINDWLQTLVYARGRLKESFQPAKNSQILSEIALTGPQITNPITLKTVRDANSQDLWVTNSERPKVVWVFDSKQAGLLTPPI